MSGVFSPDRISICLTGLKLTEKQRLQVRVELLKIQVHWLNGLNQLT